MRLWRRYNRWIRSSENRLTTREDGNWTRFGETYWHTHDKLKGFYYRFSPGNRMRLQSINNRVAWLEARERGRMEGEQ